MKNLNVYEYHNPIEISTASNERREFDAKVFAAVNEALKKESDDTIKAHRIIQLDTKFAFVILNTDKTMKSTPLVVEISVLQHPVTHEVKIIAEIEFDATLCREYYRLYHPVFMK